jgi:hypothetical protein
MADEKISRPVAVTAEQEYFQGAISAAPLPDEKTEKQVPSSEGTSIDEEKAIPVSLSKLEGTSYHDDPNIVDWDGPDDPEMAMNWPSKKKWTMTLLLSTLTLLTYATNEHTLSTLS